MILEQSMYVSTATLGAATTLRRHTDRFSVDTYHPIYLMSPAKGREVKEQKHLTVMNGTQGKLHIHTQLASKTRKPCETPYETPSSMIASGDRWLALASIGPP